jgi:hypothetical protein
MLRVPFDLPLEDSMLDRATLFYSSELSLDGGHLLLGASSAQFGECSGYWLVVASWIRGYRGEALLRVTREPTLPDEQCVRFLPE